MGKKYKKTIVKAASMPFKVIVQKILYKSFHGIIDFYNFKRASRKGFALYDKDFQTSFSFKNLQKDSRSCFMKSFGDKNDVEFILKTLTIKQKNDLILSADAIVRHEFDLLGSGKTKVSFFSDIAGVEGFKYENRSIGSDEFLKIKNFIISKVKFLVKESEGSDGTWSLPISSYDYQPVNWHIDFKSGYEWDKKLWYKNIKIGDVPGADVKVPWELSRFQHLINLGIAYRLTGDEKYSIEYVYQIVDWVENNKPEFGINWKCTMDVGIRVANLTISFLFFKGSGLMTDGFLTYFIKNIYIHCKHIMRNLEFGSITSNHYLSDISGLLIASEFLSFSEAGMKWMKFAITELKKEMEKQVYEDGGDFESSTCYHRLVLELFFYSTLFAVKGSEKNDKNYSEAAVDIFGAGYMDRLYKMFIFLLYIAKPNGEIPQIGDNDNGRFLIFGLRNSLDVSYLITLAAIFFGKPEFNIKEWDFSPEVLWLFGKKGYEKYHKLSEKSIAGLESKSFPDSGIFVFRKNKNYLVSSCCPNGQNGNGGHAHNDKLGFELQIADEDIFMDPGTYLYTPSPQWRNTFRSTSYHSTARIDSKEQNRIPGDKLFSISNDAKITIHNWANYSDYDFLEAGHSGYARNGNDLEHKRIIIFSKKEYFWIIKDILAGKGEHLVEFGFHLSPGVSNFIDENNSLINLKTRKGLHLNILDLNTQKLEISEDEHWYSPGYGLRYKCSMVRFSIKLELPAEFIFVIKAGIFNYQVKWINELIASLKNKAGAQEGN